MELLAFGMIGAVWAVWIAGIIRLVVLRRYALAVVALVPVVGVGFSIYGLVAADPRTVGA